MKGLDYLGAASVLPADTHSPSSKSVALKAGAVLVLVGVVAISLVVPVGVIVLLLRKK